MKNILPIVLVVVVLLTGIVANETFYSVDETEQVIITQFREVVGQPISEAGLNLKIPFIQKVTRIEKRILEWDGQPSEMPTKDKTYIKVDTFARWQIADPLQYFLRLRDERSAQSRLDDILGSETRNAIANHPLIEVIRTTKGRQPKQDAVIAKDPTEIAAAAAKPADTPAAPKGAPEEETEAKAGPGNTLGVLPVITRGRSKIEKDIFDQAVPKLRQFGIALLDIRFKRINYNPDVQRKIYARMISERQQIAERFRSEGQGEAARILGGRAQELNEIQSTAYKTIEEIKGEADAKATEIYAKAYNRSKAAATLYEFLKTMETYKRVIDKSTILVLSTDSDLFKFFKDSNPGTTD